MSIKLMTKNLEELYKSMSHDELVKQNVELINEIQRIQVDFEKLLGSTSKADEEFKSLSLEHSELKKAYLHLLCKYESFSQPSSFIDAFMWKVRNISHQRKHLSLIKESGLFDKDWYLKSYPDISLNKRFSKHPMIHYLKIGGFEGRDPGPDFSTLEYIKTHPEITTIKINPLVHYLYIQKQL